MKLSLRAARKLETQIETYLNENSATPTTKVRLGGSPESAETALKNGRDEFTKKFEELNSLLEIRFKIRDLIAAENAAAGVNEKLSKKVLKEKQLSRVNQILKMETRLSPEEITDTLEVGKTKMKSGSSSHYDNSTSINTQLSVLTEEDVKNFKQKKTALKKEVDTLEDEIQKTNYTSEISLDEASVKVLKNNNLV